MTDFDVLARLRRLESEAGKLQDRVSQLERSHRRYLDATEYKPKPEYKPTPEECYGAMVHAMTPKEDRKD